MVFSLVDTYCQVSLGLLIPSNLPLIFKEGIHTNLFHQKQIVMEEIFGRFPGLGKKIFQQLDNKTLANCRKFNESWKKIVDKDKTIWIRKIKKQVGHANWSRDWKMLMFKPSSDTEIDIAVAVSQFFKSKQIRMHNKWSPLHIRV